MAEQARQLAEEELREQRRREEDERRRLEEIEARQKYQRGLERDLERAANLWTTSREIRAFLDAVEVSVPVSDRGEGFRVWLEWAERYAESLDPMTQPHRLARDIDPNPEQLRRWAAAHSSA